MEIVVKAIAAGAAGFLIMSYCPPDARFLGLVVCFLVGIWIGSL